MSDSKRAEIEQKIKELEAEKERLLKEELKSSAKKGIKDMLDEPIDENEKSVVEVFNDYQLPTDEEAKKVLQDLAFFSQISLLSLGVGIVISGIIFLTLGYDKGISFVLGSLTSMFCFSILIKDYKNLVNIHIRKYKSATTKSFFKRMFIFAAILFFVYINDQKNFDLIFTFLGFLLCKFTSVIYFLFKNIILKKKKEELK